MDATAFVRVVIADGYEVIMLSTLLQVEVRGDDYSRETVVAILLMEPYESVYLVILEGYAMLRDKPEATPPLVQVLTESAELNRARQIYVSASG